MSRCVFTLEARTDLQQFHDYIARNSPANALRFVECAQLCRPSPYGNGAARVRCGPPQLRVPGTRYIVIYRPTNDGVEIIHVRHGSQELRLLFD